MKSKILFFGRSSRSGLLVNPSLQIKLFSNIFKFQNVRGNIFELLSQCALRENIFIFFIRSSIVLHITQWDGTPIFTGRKSNNIVNNYTGCSEAECNFWNGLKWQKNLIYITKHHGIMITRLHHLVLNKKNYKTFQ